VMRLAFSGFSVFSQARSSGVSVRLRFLST
jgi:hypothetical protein